MIQLFNTSPPLSNRQASSSSFLTMEAIISFSFDVDFNHVLLVGVCSGGKDMLLFNLI